MRRTIFNVVDSDGESYFVLADTVPQAYERFKAWWISEADSPELWEEPQHIALAGELIGDLLVPASGGPQVTTTKEEW